MSGRRKAGEETHRLLVRSAVELFLEHGYQGTTMQMIAGQAGVTAAAMYRHFADKEAVLRELIALMFENQFAMAGGLLAGERDGLTLYAVETALQLHITELSEALRDLYVSAYTMPTTSEYIYRRTAAKLAELFGRGLPGWELKDFYEMEIASAGIVRGYMARPCDLYFTLEHKTACFLEAALKLYEVPRAQRLRVIQRVLELDLRGMAEALIAGIRDKAAGLEPDGEGEGGEPA